MKWRKNLYVGKQVRKHVRRIRKRLDAGKTDVGHYLITLAENPHDQLDIINTVFLTSAKKRDSLPEIVGLAGSEKEAILLVKKITEDCLKESGTADLRTYLTV